MRRPELTLTVDADASVAANTAAYELTQSPSTRKSEDSQRSSLSMLKAGAALSVSPELESPVSHIRDEAVYTPPVPSLRVLFSSLSRRDALIFLLPALIASMIAGGIAPFMTLVVGNVFDAFAQFPVTGATAADAARLKRDIGIAAAELIALGVGAAALGSVTSALWIATGERNVRRVRERVYDCVMAREMGWFDTAMGDEDSNAEGITEGNAGAGGLMAKFNRDTDDVRSASALAAGMLLQYLTTCLACLGLAFARSWALTLVILSALPVLIVVQGISQAKAGRHVGAERSAIAKSADLITRALDAVRTVKAFNAQESELKSFGAAVDELKQAGNRAITVWAFSSGASQTTSMAMFVQGFWFGAKLVRDGTTSAGEVMAVFWACLIAASNLQMCVPQLVVLARGKFAAAALVAMIEAPTSTSNMTDTSGDGQEAGVEAGAEAKVRLSQSSQATLIPLTPPKAKSRRSADKSQDLRKIMPTRIIGEFALHDVTFAYPAHPTRLALDNVSLYFPAGETTFVVGRSGSGKSTVGALLAGLYKPTHGHRALDEQDAAFLDPAFLKAHVALVPQRTALFAGTVHANVALAGGPRGVAPEDVSRAQVEDACRAALVHEFVRELPDGYDTCLGEGGAQLSGGQRQRIAVARALLKRPTILILDEATSALDGPSRALVHAAVRAQRRNMTTIVITHDLSQIDPGDFLYVMQNGRIAEQGFRADLERPLPPPPAYAYAIGGMEEAHEMEREVGAGRWGAFASMIHSEDKTTSGQEEENEDAPWEAGIDDNTDSEDEHHEPENGNAGIGMSVLAQQNSALAGLIGGAVQEIARTRSLRRLTLGSVAPSSERHLRHASYDSSFVLPPPVTTAMAAPANKRLAKHASLRPMRKPELVRRLSLQFTPMSPAFEEPAVEDDEEFEEDKNAVERSGVAANLRRAARGQVQRRKPLAVDIVIDNQKSTGSTSTPSYPPRSMLALARIVWPTLPGKPLVIFGLVLCILSGAMTPAFAFVLSRLLFLVSSGAKDVSSVNIFGGVVLALAVADGIFMGAKYFVMETRAGAWVAALRRHAYKRVLAQDTAFFDSPKGESVRIVQTLVKDAEDARNLIAVCVGQSVAVVSMLGVGLIWALVQGWQLTLAGLAIAPVFAGVMAVQARLVANTERRNKTAREEVAKAYYESLSNIRAIRSMALEHAFDSRFAASVESAQTIGMRGALVEGCSFGVANGLIYLAEALLFFVGAELVANGTYTYLRMVEVLNLVVFTVTIGAQLMAFTQKIAKASNAAWDLNELLSLSLDTNESHGIDLPLDGPGRLEFKNVRFAYPARPDVPILRDVSLSIAPGECVAVVGASGSGKSTLVQLAQRFYEPCLPIGSDAEKITGSITLDGADLRSLSVNALRARLAVVSQAPHLFDASVADNIAYGDASMPAEEIERAAREAHVHEFVEQLTDGYATRCGAAGALLSGGQAQRVAVARSLATRTSDSNASASGKLLLLDECTSALDPVGSAEVLDAVRNATRGRTTLLVTHKLTEMRICDRIVVMEDGRVAEEGRYDELMARNGVFARLARGGEWVSD